MAEVIISRAPAGVTWRRLARCLTSTRCPDFFTSDTEERYVCRAVCFACPVRWDCLSSALNTPELIGIWGGVDEYEIRRALSVNSKGEPVERARKPRCPYCKSHNMEIGQKTRRGTTVKCKMCTLSWTMPLQKRARKAPAATSDLHPNIEGQSDTNELPSKHPLD